jgi:hypothetical protein
MRITDMTQNEFNKYIGYGEDCLRYLPAAVAEWKREYGVDPIPSSIMCRDNLPDMYMRHGMWDQSTSVYERCAAIEEIMSELDKADAIARQDDRRKAVNAIEALLKAHGAPMNQNQLKKSLADVDKNAVNWALRFYHKFSRDRQGSVYYVRIIED